MSRQADLVALWRTIQLAGSIEGYVKEQLVQRGYLIERRATDDMSERELEEYKKQLKAEAEERRKIKKEAWQAYRAAHVVHLGEGVHWSDKGGAPASTRVADCSSPK